MTLATGKGGRYRYYKCNTRIGQGRTLCTTRSIPMGKLDATVLHALADRVLTGPRIRAMLADLRSKLNAGHSNEARQVRVLQAELEKIAAAQERLYEAVENGVLPQDAILHARVHRHQRRRQEILLEIGGRPRAIAKEHWAATSRCIRARSAREAEKLLANKPFAKQYLRRLVSEIRVERDRLTVIGSSAALRRQ